MKPILFNTEMAKAILAGNKTQTRRIIKEAKPDYCFEGLDDCATMIRVRANGEEYGKDVDGLWATFYCDGYPEFPMIRSKYEVSDVLWVRETWMKTDSFGMQNGFLYKANAKQNAVIFENTTQRPKWRPSIHMPKEAARLFLKVTNVRVERVQDITGDDAMAEGMEGAYTPGGSFCPEVDEFRTLWDALYVKQGFGWDANPWIWVYEFERIEKP